MPHGAFFSLFAVDKDDGQLLQEDNGQLHYTEQISKDMQQFERELHQQVLLPSLSLRISSTKRQ